MFPAKNRLAAAEVALLTRGGALVQNQFLALRYQASEVSAAAVVVSKKVARSAVMRHLVRRRVYAALRELGFLETQRALVVITRKGVTNLSYSQLKEELQALLLHISPPTSTL